MAIVENIVLFNTKSSLNSVSRKSHDRSQLVRKKFPYCVRLETPLPKVRTGHSIKDLNFMCTDSLDVCCSVCCL